MALPQDGQNANGLTKVTEIPKGKELIFIDPTTNEGGIITLEDLTTQILKNLTSQTFALDQGNMTLLAALNQLNSNKKIKYERIPTLSSLQQLKESAIFNFDVIDSSLLIDKNQNKMTDATGDYYVILIAKDFTNNGGVAYGTLLLFSPRIYNGFWIGNIWNSEIRTWNKITSA